MRLARFDLALGLGLSWALGCGSRTELGEGAPPPGAPIACEVDSECDSGDLCHPGECFEGFCQYAAPIECDDSDPCTEDSCSPVDGQCVFEPLTVDLDGDGFRGPRPGYAPGAPDSCGDDCDDTSALAYPGGVEYCDGLDNDCNGVRDDGAVYQRVPGEPIRLTNTDDGAVGASGLEYDGSSYALSWHLNREFRFTRLSPAGDIELETPILDINAGTYGGPLVYTGQFYGVAWSDDRASGNYEVFFNRLDQNGTKFGPDLRITNAEDFSRIPALIYHAGEFLLVWDDWRNRDVVGNPWVGIYAQKVSLDGEAVGGNVLLTPQGVWAELSSVAVGDQRIAIAYTSPAGNDGQGMSAHLTSLPLDLAGDVSTIDIAPGIPVAPGVRFLGDRFLVTWFEDDLMNGVGDAIWGQTFDEVGNPLTGPTRLTDGAEHARSANARPLGDRFLLFWADDKDGNYELYVKMLDNDLVEMSPRERLTFAEGQSLSPLVQFGPSGEIGVVFRDERTPPFQLYFLRLACNAGLF